MDHPEGSPGVPPAASPEMPAAIPEQNIPQPEVNPAPPETQANKVAERAPERGGNINQKQTGAADAGTSLPPVQAPANTPQPVTSNQADEDDDNTPLIADDVDVIEMEWVNKAKEIIKKTRQDPHAQEQAVEKLQIDYLKKRYGKDVRSSRSG